MATSRISNISMFGSSNRLVELSSLDCDPVPAGTNLPKKPPKTLESVCPKPDGFKTLVSTQQYPPLQNIPLFMCYKDVILTQKRHLPPSPEDDVVHSSFLQSEF